MRTKSYPSRPQFIIDVANHDVDYGGQIDWSKVPNAAPYSRPDGSRTIPAGTLMVRNNTTGLRYPREFAGAGEVAAYITWNAIQEKAREDSHKAYAMIVGGQMWKNLLAAHHVANAAFEAWLTEFRGAGTGARFETYQDSRVG